MYIYIYIYIYKFIYIYINLYIYIERESNHSEKNYIIPLISPLTVLFCLFFVVLWTWSCFCVKNEKISFSCPDFVDSEISLWRLTFLIDFYKGVQLLFKNMYLCSKNAPEIHIFNSWRHQKLLEAKKLQGSTILFEINNLKRSESKNHSNHNYFDNFVTI